MKTLFPHPNGQPGDTSGKTSGHTGKISRLFTGRGTRFTTNRGARATLLVLVFIIVISGALLIRYHTFIVPFRQCSETYQHYAGQPGIEATFIKRVSRASMQPFSRTSASTTASPSVPRSSRSRTPTLGIG